MRSFTFGLALACAGAISSGVGANPLPDGEYMLGTYIWGVAHLPRYVTLFVDGDDIEVEVFSVLPMNYETCDTPAIGCSFSVTALSGRVIDRDGMLDLSEIRIAPGAEAAIDDHPSSAPYIPVLLAALDNARATPTDTGFVLERAGGNLEFFETDAAARRLIAVFPAFYEQSIEGLAACEVRQLAPVLADPDAHPDMAPFLAVLRVASRLQEASRRLEETIAATPDADPSDPATQRIRVLSMLPNMLTTISDAPDFDAVRDRAFDDIFSRLLDGDRTEYDAMIAEYGAQDLAQYVAFFAHIRRLRPEMTASALCADPAMGFTGLPN